MDDVITEDSFNAANESGRQAIAAGPCAVSARYEVGQDRRIVVELDNGCAFAFPVDQAEGLADAKDADLTVIEVSPSGLGLHWPTLDADLGVPALVRGVLGTRQWMAQLGQAGGKSRSDRKAAAARANGRRGGRPIQVGGTRHYIKGASGKNYPSVEVTAAEVFGHAGILIVERGEVFPSRSIINADAVNAQLADLNGDPSIDRILYISQRDAVKRQKIVLDLEAGLTVRD